VKISKKSKQYIFLDNNASVKAMFHIWLFLLISMNHRRIITSLKSNPSSECANYVMMTWDMIM